MNTKTKQDFLKFELLSPYMTAYDDGDNPPAPPEPNPSPDPHTKPTKTFTQEEMNKIIQQRVGELQGKIEEITKSYEKDKRELLTQLEERERNATLTEEERRALQKRIEELRTESLSTEEAAKKQIKSLEESLNETKRRAEDEVKTWRERYNQFRMTEELRTAALQHDARAPEQLVELLLKRTKVEEAVDDAGQHKGDFVVKTAIEEFKEDGTPFTVECAPLEAIARLKAQPERWGNQFNSQVQKGLDLMSAASDAPKSKNSGLVLSKGFAAYKQSRQNNADILGLNAKR